MIDLYAKHQNDISKACTLDRNVNNTYLFWRLFSSAIQVCLSLQLQFHTYTIHMSTKNIGIRSIFGQYLDNNNPGLCLLD